MIRAAGVTVLILGLIVAWSEYMRIERNARKQRELDRHTDEAIALTEPIGPEDRDDWGQQ